MKTPCKTCKGTGKVREMFDHSLARMGLYEGTQPCFACKGTGVTEAKGPKDPDGAPP